MKKIFNFQFSIFKYTNNKILLFRVLILIAGIYILYVTFRSFQSSLIFQKRDRINVVFYGQNPRIYSFGLSDAVHYYIPLYSDLRVVVPGGYGSYRLGGLGKLVKLERKPDMYQRTFSSVISSFIDGYFYHSDGSIYYGGENTLFTLPRIKDILINSSNLNMFDRVYVVSLFMGKGRGSFKVLDQLPVDEQSVFLYNDFYKRYQGYFYHSLFREEKMNVQLIFTDKYDVANRVSHIIEGQGIRVVDLMQQEESKAECKVITSYKTLSKTAELLSHFFKCPITSGNTEPYDIKFSLGNTEKEWEIL